MNNHIELKAGVKFKQLNTHFASFINAVCRAWWICTPSVIPAITSGNDSKHMDGSLHYKDKAWDLRTNNLTGDKVEAIAHMLRTDLGPDWDVVIEKTHLHVEYDRKGI